MPKLAIAAGITAFAAWGFLPLIRLVRNVILHVRVSSFVSFFYRLCFML